MKNDTYFIKRCEISAEEAIAKGKTPVGPVIIKVDEMISETIEVLKNQSKIIKN